MWKLQMLWISASLFFLVHSIVSAQELSAKEKIRIHKEWLERRAALRALHKHNSTTETSLAQHLLKIKDLEERRQQWQRKLKKKNLSPHPNSDKAEEPSHNDVYPEEEKHFAQASTAVPSDMLDKVEPRTPLPEATSTVGTTTPSVLSEDAATSPLPRQESTSTANPPADEVPVTKKTRVKVKKFYPRWTPWSRWSECSRSCGGGVMYQERKCVSKHSSGKRIISKGCTGLYRRYHLCNEQHCPAADADFRQRQCSSFDGVPFKGRKYVWESYIKGDAECELNCKPVGMQYFATLNHSVVDGTPCFRPAEYYRKNYRDRAICVDGICKALHPSGTITGAFANSGTVHCGGLLCRPISGIFTKDPLPNGYVHVATLPAGASNISITELKNSINLLALKTVKQKFLFNGDYEMTSSGPYEAAGTIFDYRRIDGLSTSDHGRKIEGVTEWITATGPTLEPIHLMVLGEDVNPGIKYEYLLPITSNYDSEEEFLDGESIEDDSLQDASNETGISLKSGIYSSETSRPTEKKRHKFSWKVVGFSPCSKSCGGGTQTPIIRCVRDNPGRYFSPRRCSHSEKPILNDNLLRCNTQPCPAYWRMEDWGDCSCIHGEGYRERETRCVQELAVGIVIQVDSVACMEEAPSSRKKCECPKLGRRRHNKRLHIHPRAPESLILANSTQRTNYRSERTGIWLVSDWNRHCSAECGSGVEHRSIFCDRSPPHIGRCDLRSTPDTSRTCENEKFCESGEWFTSPWGQCSGSCFNLTKSRQVICIRSQLIVDDDECKISEKPNNTRSCAFDEVEYCKSRWHYSEWTECSKTCDGGTQKRSVKCLELNLKENGLKESHKCRYTEREPIFRSCNTQECPELVDPRADLVQNDIAPGCVDEIENCEVIVRARLCSYDYYQENCCYSCRAM